MDNIGFAYLLYKAEKPSVCLSPFFDVTLLTWSSLHGLTWDLVCVIAVISGIRMVISMNC